MTLALSARFIATAVLLWLLIGVIAGLAIGPILRRRRLQMSAAWLRSSQLQQLREEGDS